MIKMKNKKIIWVTCESCGKKITDHGSYYDTDKETCYTKLGAGPLCSACYLKLQKIDDMLKLENNN